MTRPSAAADTARATGDRPVQRGGVGSLQRKCACGQHTVSGQECEECGKGKSPLRRASGPHGGQPGTPGEVPPIVHDVLRSPGTPLDRDARRFMESAFGHDFGRVRVHADSHASASAREVNALAYTVGPHVVFGSGQYSPGTRNGQRLLAHELAHVVQQVPSSETPESLQINDPHETAEHEADQAADRALAGAKSGRLQRATTATRLQRATGGTPSTGGGAAGSGTGTPASGGPARVDVDVLAAEDPDDFLVRAAARNLGTDLRVRSMTDLSQQVAALTSGRSCVASLDVFNHANPAIQTVSGGNKIKLPSGERREQPLSGFSLMWLLDQTNRDSLNRLRGSMCCHGSEMRWYGCSTAGVWAEGGQRTAAEVRESEHRFKGTFGSFYQSVEDAAAHGATRFRFIGSVNVQSWANALCTPVSAATDFNSWSSTGNRNTPTVIHGGRQLRIVPQADVACACDPATGRVSGPAPTTDEMRARAEQLREQALRPTYERTRSVIGSEQAPVAESEESRRDRERFEQAQAAHIQELSTTIRGAVLQRAGFQAGTQPTTPDEALRVIAPWGITIATIVAALPTVSASLSGQVRGQQAAEDLHQRQRDFEAALTPTGRETFLSALLEVRRDRFWNDYLARNTVFIFPDLTGLNRYRGFTQTGTRTDDAGRTHTVHIIHISKDLLEAAQTELVVTNLVHELTHTVHEPKVLARAFETINRDLAELLAEHPDVIALRSGAADPAAARQEHVSRIKQMLYEVTGYPETEIMALLQQLTHQPSMTVNGVDVSGTRFVLMEVTSYVKRLRQIGLPPRMLSGILDSIGRRTAILYDRRIAATPEGSTDRRRMALNKQLAADTLRLAITLSEEGTP